MKKILLLISLFLTSALYAQQTITYKGSGNYILKERTDLRRYDNGKYIGLVSREVSSYIVPISNENGYLYDGNFYLLQDTKRASVSVTGGINDAIPSVFRINSEGYLEMLEDNGYPTFRSFPSFPKEKIKIGDSWSGSAERTVDPLNKGIYTKVPVYAQYTYKSDSTFHEQEVYVIEAQWATRYGMGIGSSYIDPAGDSELVKANGSHKASMYISKATGNALVIRDTVDEVFVYSDGKQVALKGTISLFTEYPPSVEEEKLLPAIKRLAQLDEDNSVKKEEKLSDSLITKINNHNNSLKVEKVQEGLRLTIEDLQFKANSSELLPGEEKRLNAIAEILKQAPSSQFLIAGHTASIGNPKGEYELSVERAHSIANELTKRGIAPERFICKGYGGTKPVGDNSTSEGKAKNRRVEITILE